MIASRFWVLAYEQRPANLTPFLRTALMADPSNIYFGHNIRLLDDPKSPKTRSNIFLKRSMSHSRIIVDEIHRFIGEPDKYQKILDTLIVQVSPDRTLPNIIITMLYVDKPSKIDLIKTFPGFECWSFFSDGDFDAFLADVRKGRVLVQEPFIRL